MAPTWAVPGLLKHFVDFLVGFLLSCSKAKTSIHISPLRVKPPPWVFELTTNL